MKEENFNEKENCSAAFKYCDGVFLNSMWMQPRVQPLHFTDGAEMIA